MVRSKKILLIHGRGPKPDPEQTYQLWVAALKAGIERDKPKLAAAFAATPTELFYYADQLRHHYPPDFDAKQDLQDRHEALNLIQQLKKTSDFRRRYYDQLPGKTALKEFAMDASATLGLASLLEKQVLPELAEYRKAQAPWVQNEKERLTQTIAHQLASDSELLIVAHCLGSVLAYDALWNLSYANSDIGQSKINLITLGSPLGANRVQKTLQGADLTLDKRYPRNIQLWHNLAAEDDYVSHDKTVADDYHMMLQSELLEDIQDHTIYNPTLRFGLSNPHSSLGYLAHPKTASLIAGWLKT